NVDIIEVYYERWKRAREGPVGGHWGLFDATTRMAKFAGAAAVSNHPLWLWQGSGGILFAVIVFAAAMSVCTKDTPLLFWFAVGANAFVGGVLVGWAIANIPVESLGIGGWLRALRPCPVAMAGRVLVSAGTMWRTTRAPPLPS